jgi:predicted exporter
MDELLQPRPCLALALGGGGLLLLLMLVIKAPPLWENDLAALSPVPRELLRVDQELRSALGAPEVGHLIVLTAPDAETALRHGEIVAAYLEARQAEGCSPVMTAPCAICPAAHAAAAAGVLPEAEPLAARTWPPPWKDCRSSRAVRAVSRGGGHCADCAAAAARRLERDTLLGARINALLFPGASGWTALLPLSGVRDAPALAAGLPQAERLVGLITSICGRKPIGWWRASATRRCNDLVWGVALIVAVVWIGLRSWRRVVAALLPVFWRWFSPWRRCWPWANDCRCSIWFPCCWYWGVGVDYGLFSADPTPIPICADVPCTRYWSAVVRR